MKRLSGVSMAAAVLLLLASVAAAADSKPTADSKPIADNTPPPGFVAWHGETTALGPLATLVAPPKMPARTRLLVRRRQRKWEMTPPSFTTPFVALFNGKDLNGWKGLLKAPLDNPARRAKLSPDELAKAQKEADDDMRAHWKVEDGVIVFDGKGRSLCTATDYRDFEMYVDWKIPPGGDSGIYLRGSPQVQIWDSTRNAVGSGGLYNNQQKENPRDPIKPADKPIGQWNTFRIKMVGEKVSVWLNGELVVDNVTLENYWERGKPIYPVGQIELQNHGDHLYFKNIYIREIESK
jgi:hypothetical protein